MFPTHKRPQTKTRLPFTRDQLAKAGLPPPGRYNFIIIQAYVTPGRTDEQLVVDFEIANGGLEDGRVVRQYYSLAPHQREAIRRLFHESGALQESSEDAVAVEELFGRGISAELQTSVGEDGKEWPRLVDLGQLQ